MLKCLKPLLSCSRGTEQGKSRVDWGRSMVVHIACCTNRTLTRSMYSFLYARPFRSYIMIYKILDFASFVYYTICTMDISDLATTIQRARKAKGLTQEGLAKRAGISRPLLANLETGRLGELGVTKLLRILHVLDLDLRLTELNRSRPTLDDLRAANEGEGS